MGSYEAEQQQLEQFLQEVLSDEDTLDDESVFGDVDLSDDYNPSSSSESDIDPPAKKRCLNKTSKQTQQKLSQPSKDVSTCNDKNQRSKKENQEQNRPGPSALKFVDQPHSSTDTSRENTEKEQDTELQNVDAVIEEVVQAYEEESDEDDEGILQTVARLYDSILWEDVTGAHMKSFTFADEKNSGFASTLYENFYNKSPYEFYCYFVNEDLLNLIVTETNRYATQCGESNIHPHSRITEWKDTYITEIRHFLGIVMWMGLCHLPSIQHYWSKETLYRNFVKDVMSRNRFQLLLKTLHFNDNMLQSDDRLHKLHPLIENLRNIFQRSMVPGEHVCIDETLVPFQGRLKFKQYIANKRHKFGIKLFKLCIQGGLHIRFQDILR